jgi:hypothetical protein
MEFASRRLGERRLEAVQTLGHTSRKLGLTLPSFFAPCFPFSLLCFLPTPLQRGFQAGTYAFNYIRGNPPSSKRISGLLSTSASTPTPRWVCYALAGYLSTGLQIHACCLHASIIGSSCDHSGLLHAAFPDSNARSAGCTPNPLSGALGAQ